MLKKGLITLIVLLLVTGCSAQTGKQELNDVISMLEQELNVEAPNQTTLQTHCETLRRLYDKHEWKIQLLGDEGEYEGLNETMNRFIAAVVAEQMIYAKLELATLKTILHDIYSL